MEERLSYKMENEVFTLSRIVLDTLIKKEKVKAIQQERERIIRKIVIYNENTPFTRWSIRISRLIHELEEE